MNLANSENRSEENKTKPAHWKIKIAKIAAVVAAAMGVIVVGGSWYSGKQVEQHYGELVAQANSSLKKLKQNDIEAELKDVKVDRGWFSSEVTYQIEATIDNQHYQFQGKDKLFHGPFPFNRLSKGHLLPMMASSESYLSVPDNLKTIFSQPELLTATTDIGYTERLSGKINFSPFKYSQIPLEFAAGEAEFDLDKSGQGVLKLWLPQLTYGDIELGSQMSLEQAEYKMALKPQEDYQALYIGDVTAKAKSLMWTNGKYYPRFQLNDLDINASSYIINDEYLANQELTATVLMGRYSEHQNLGQFKFSYSLHLDAAALNAVSQSLFSPAQSQSAEVEQAMKALLAKPILLFLHHASLENRQGKSGVSLILNSDKITPEFLNDPRKILANFKQSYFDAKVNLAFLELFLKQVALTDKRTADDAEYLAKKTVADLVKEAKTFDFLRVDEQNIELSIEVDQNKVKLYGVELPEDVGLAILFKMLFGIGTIVP